MPKTRTQKEQLVETYKSLIGDSKMVVLLGYQGLAVDSSEAIRQKFFENEQQFVIVKNNLLKIALNKNNLELPAEFFDRPLAIATTNTDEALVARDINDFAKILPMLEIMGGIYEGKVVDKEVVMQLANLPSKEELLAKTVFAIASPLSGLVNVVRGPLSGLVNVLHQVNNQKS